jgi:hypothetical protein
MLGKSVISINITGLCFSQVKRLHLEPVGLRANLLQIRLDGPYYAAFFGNRTTIALQNRQNLSSPSQIFASIS